MEELVHNNSAVLLLRIKHQRELQRMIQSEFTLSSSLVLIGSSSEAVEGEGDGMTARF